MTLSIAPSVPLEKVEWRVDGKPVTRGNEVRCRFVPYMDGRDVARLLDEWVGPDNWRDEPYIEATMFGGPCLWAGVSIRVEGEWVTKWDVGVPSNFEAQKGAVSDAFKRAATVKWGVGRNVYDLPTIWAPCNEGKDGKAYPNDNTLPYILRELKKQGFEASGGRVIDSSAQSQETQAGSAPQQLPTAEPSASPPQQTATQPDAAPPDAAAPPGETSGAGGSQELFSTIEGAVEVKFHGLTRAKVVGHAHTIAGDHGFKVTDFDSLREAPSLLLVDLIDRFGLEAAVV